jgi:hypothetical protein
LERLRRLYSATTGKAPGVSHSHDHYTDSQSEPGGPFLRLVSAVVILLDEQRTPEAIAKAIQRSAGQK